MQGFFDKTYNSPSDFVERIFNIPYYGIHHTTFPNNLSDLVRLGVETSYEIYHALRPVFAKKAPQSQPKRKSKYVTWTEGPAPATAVTYFDPFQNFGQMLPPQTENEDNF